MPLIAEVFPVEKDDFVSAGEVSAKIKRTLQASSAWTAPVLRARLGLFRMRWS